MMKDYANDWRSKLTDVSKLFDKEEEAKSWLQKYDEKATKLGKEVIEKNGEKLIYQCWQVQVNLWYLVMVE